eukprot:CAMPEP_0117683574 /NCGR_PEP_ID=MMETSP0804-20121206/20492_1 /TAXON_ID=1074897 /ORGANISM="Tetraselmis astigmatica, Strain CCMP880" /LENGTH=46 /DNA_ID= /DNA_START= /DNA_END= /DNA_ORIENTATION=
MTRRHKTEARVRQTSGGGCEKDRPGERGERLARDGVRGAARSAAKV